MLRIKGLTKIFGRGGINEKRVLDKVDFTLETGEFITIIGGNGAGKSTLLNCVAGVHPVDGGRIFLDSRDITFSPEYKRSRYIGRVFQDPMQGTAFDMTIEENLAIAHGKGGWRGFGPGVTKAGVALFRERLALLGLGLEKRIKEKVGFLSAGQRQGLTLLMATLVRPKLLLLDEHTAALDPSTAENVLRLTGKIVAEGKLSTMMITHNMSVALAYGTRTIMMHEGRIIFDLQGKERENISVEQLIGEFKHKSGTRLDNDRMLLH